MSDESTSENHSANYSDVEESDDDSVSQQSYSASQRSAPQYDYNAPQQGMSTLQQYYNPQQDYSTPQQDLSDMQQDYSAPQQDYSLQQDYSAPQQDYSAPQQDYSAPQFSSPHQDYSAPQQGYSQQEYSAPQQDYSAPQQEYGVPQLSSPQQDYNAPQQGYSQQDYSAPQQEYSAPQQEYGAPQQYYSAPQQEYGAPQQELSLEESLNYSKIDTTHQQSNDSTLGLSTSQIVEPEVVITAANYGNTLDTAIVDLGLVEESFNQIYVSNEMDAISHSSSKKSLETSPISNSTSSNTILSPKQVDPNRQIVSPDTAPLPDGWLQYFTDDGWPYYYHTATNVSSWDHPSLSLSYIDTVDSSSNSNNRNNDYNESYNIPMNNKPPTVENASIATTRNAAGQSPIHISAQECMFEGIRILLNSGIPADLPDSKGCTSLHLVCAQPFNSLQITCIQLLLDYGANINYISPFNGDSLVHSTIRYGNVQVMEYLFQCGAAISHTNNEGDTPLHLAAKIAQFQCMQALVLLTERKNNTPPVNRSRSNSNTTSVSSKSNDNNAWKAYEQAKANGIIDRSENPLEIIKNHSKYQKNIKKNRSNDVVSDMVSVNSSDVYTAPPREPSRIANEWIEYYTADGNVYYYNERTQKVQWENPATNESTYKVIQTRSAQLVDEGGDEGASYHSKSSIDWEKRDQYKNNKSISKAQHQPLLLKETGGMRTYVASNSSIQRNTAVTTDTSYYPKQQYQTPPPKTTPLNPSASPIEPIKISETLSRSRSEDSISDLSDDNTSVGPNNMKEKHLRVWNRFFENALKISNNPSDEANKKRILPYNFNFDIAYVNDVWPGALAEGDYRQLLSEFISDDPTSTTELVIDYNKVTPALISCIVREDYIYTERLLLLGQHASGVDENIRSPVHYTCKNGNLEILALLYDHGADLEAEDMYGRTPLHIASYYKNNNIISFLLECAVNVNAEDIGGNTALHICARIGNIDGCRSLLQYGSSPNTVNKLGLDALAALKAFLNPSEKSQEIEELLLNYYETAPVRAPKASKRDKIVTNLLTKAKDIQKDERSKAVKEVGKSSVDSVKEERVKAVKEASKSAVDSVKDQVSSSGKSSGKSVPWENLSITTNLPPPPTVTKEVSDVKQSKVSESAELDDYEEDEDDDEPSSVTDAMWGVASSLIDVTLSMFSRGADKKNSSNNEPKTSRGYALSQNASKARTATTATTSTWSNNNHVPPTDNELKAKGLGFHPPAFIAEELNAQVEAIRTGLTPRRVNPSPPVEVALIVEHAKREAERIKSSPLASSAAQSRQSTYPKPKPMTIEGNELPPPPQNGYSMGKMQSGVSWRYVDVLADRQILENQK